MPNLNAYAMAIYANILVIAAVEINNRSISSYIRFHLVAVTLYMKNGEIRIP